MSASHSFAKTLFDFQWPCTNKHFKCKMGECRNVSEIMVKL